MAGTVNRGLFRSELKKNWPLFLMILPATLIVFVFSYIPMTGLVLAFKEYKFNLGIFGSPWAKNHGLYNFRFLFLSGKGWIITRNTILYNIATLGMSQLLGLTLAISISEMYGRIYKRLVQSLVFVPYFVSWIIVGAFVLNIFNYEHGVMNTLIKRAGGTPINLYAIPSAWPFVIVAFHAWKWSGYNSIIYIASITNLDTDCLEAAEIDGASIWQRIFYVVLPSILPTIIIILLLNLGGILRGDFAMIYQIVGNNGQLYNMTEVIDTYVFRSLTSGTDFGMTAAAAFYQNVVCFAIIVTVNWLVKRYSADYALF